MNPLICIRGSASPGHSYPMTPLHVKNAGDSPMQVTYSANPGYAMSWLKVSPVEILPGESASIPVTLAVPSNAGSGEAYVILTAGGARFDVRFSVGVPPPRECVAAGYKPPQGTSPLVFLWLIVLVVIVLVAFWVRRRLAGRVLTGKPRTEARSASAAPFPILWWPWQLQSPGRLPGILCSCSCARRTGRWWTCASPVSRFPDYRWAHDEDANWLQIRGSITLADGKTWAFEDPCLRTWDARS